MGCCTGYNFAPAPDAALDPNQRVNFSFGMVLGVDDFRQEHAWLAARDERALRELIGYGTITGLGVSTGVTGSAVEVRVAPGLALLPDGKLVGVAADQCARLDEWLAGPGKAGADGKSGKAAIYVVLRHVEVSGTPVPIPGEPCRDESALLADSRIADSFTLDFSWSPPAQSEDAAARSFAAWLRRVPVLDLPVPEPTLAEFQAEVAAQLPQVFAHAAGAFANPPLAETPAPDPDPGAPASPPSTLVIPRAHYAAFVNAAFDVWVRELRVGAMAHFGPVPAAEDAADAGLLLAAIDITLDAGNLLLPVDKTQTAIARWLGRAQLVHLRLLQEWVVSNVENDAPREADYVLGRFDARLPNAQYLDRDFAAHNHAMARVDFIPAPTPDDDGASKAVLRPAVKWPGSGGKGRTDYYGPFMTAPIRVEDGGTAQARKPARGELLLGVDDGAAAPGRFALGHVYGTTRMLGEGDAAVELADIVVTIDAAPGAPNLGLGTIQGITPMDSPQFAGLAVAGEISAITLAVSGAASAQSLTLELPLPVGSGGTAQNADPALGQLLVGTPAAGEDAARFRLGALRPVERSSGEGDASVTVTNLTVDVASAAPDILIDTVQPIGPTDAPSFGALTLDAPLPIASGGTGRNDAPQRLQVLIGDHDGADGRFVLATLVAGSGVSLDLQNALPQARGENWQLLINAAESGGSSQTHWATRLVKDGDSKLLDTDHVLVFTAKGQLQLGPAQDERVVVVKALGGATEGVAVTIVAEGASIDGGRSLALEPGRAVTLIGNAALKNWLVIGRA